MILKIESDNEVCTASSDMCSPDFSEVSHVDISTFTEGIFHALSSLIWAMVKTDETLIFCFVWQFGLLLF